MRIFTRRLRESVTIGTRITVTVVEIRGKQVRIGVSAPSDVDIQREEIVGKGRQTSGRSGAAS